MQFLSKIKALGACISFSLLGASLACSLDKGGTASSPTDARVEDGEVEVDTAGEVSTDTQPADVPVTECGDGVKNGAETDVDCGGGVCGACGGGRACVEARDCISRQCAMGRCVDSCADGTRNNDETDVDCGGSCDACADGRKCGKPADCASGTCSGGICGVSKCDDGVKNGDETDVDCGGTVCPRCALGKGCSGAASCVTSFCAAGVCARPPSCSALHAAAPGLTSGIYKIDPDGAGAGTELDVYCDMVTAGGGWTFLAHVNQDYVGGTLFGVDTGTYRADRADDATTYGRAASLLPNLMHTEMMVTIDMVEPAAAVAASRLVIFQYKAGLKAFNGGPVPCSGLDETFQYRLSPTDPLKAARMFICDATRWQARVDDGSLSLVLFSGGSALGQYWGAGIGGDNSWNHDAWWYVR